jgi:hypothetical protein
MSSRQLSEPITDGGIQNVNFFNGRLLTADDLSDVLSSGREHDRQLAKGLGEGVVTGLEVELANTSTTAKPVVRVGGGLALCRSGNPVALSVPTVDVALVKAPATFEAEAGVFAECAGPEASDNLSKLGVYVFVASPASTYEGSVPMRHSVSNSNFDGCGRRYAVEGVKFRMERINFSTLPGVSDATRALLGTLTAKNDDASVSVLRNVVAHLCFDSEEKNGARRDPFRRPAGGADFVNYGALAELRASGQLSDCDVPLAVVYWSQQGVRFVDNWAARRLARRQLDSDVESLLRSYGYERLLQFQRHLRDLFDSLGSLASARLQDYFAFVPPAGYFPVTGNKSPKGFSPTNFFKKFTTGSAADASADSFAALLRDSFACPDVALGAGPLFTVLRLRENTAAVGAGGTSSQLFQAFVSRSMNGPLWRDGVATAVCDAWEVYRGLIRRRLFLMPGTDQDTVASNSIVTGAVRDVMDMSNRQCALASARALDAADALAAYRDMHRVQDDLAELLVGVVGVRDASQDREKFGKGLSRLLNQTIAGGQPGLLPAVNAQNLPAAVAAQNAINFFVSNWTGVGIAVGPITLAPGSSPKGLVAVKGTPTDHHFILGNGTDKTLKIELEATATAAGDWGGSTQLFKAGTGGGAESVTLAPAASAEVIVRLTAPQDAVDDAPVTLVLGASAPQFGKTASAVKNLKVGVAGSAVTSSVEFIGPVSSTTPDSQLVNADPGAFISFTYRPRYNAPANVTSPANFLVTVKLTPTTEASTPGDWKVGIGGVSATALGGDHSKGEYTTQIQLGPGQTGEVIVMLTTPASRGGADKTATLVLKLDSVGLQPAIPTAVSPTKTVTVRKTT